MLKFIEQITKKNMEMFGSTLAATIDYMQGSMHNMTNPEVVAKNHMKFMEDMTAKCVEHNKEVYEMVSNAAKVGMHYSECCKK